MAPASKDKNKVSIDLSTRDQLVFLYLQSHELEETLKRLGQNEGVLGTIVVNSEGKYTELSLV